MPPEVYLLERGEGCVFEEVVVQLCVGRHPVHRHARRVRHRQGEVLLLHLDVDIRYSSYLYLHIYNDLCASPRPGRG